MNKISFVILCNYVQSVVITFCLLLSPSISSYRYHMLACEFTSQKEANRAETGLKSDKLDLMLNRLILLITNKK